MNSIGRAFWSFKRSKHFRLGPGNDLISLWTSILEKEGRKEYKKTGKTYSEENNRSKPPRDTICGFLGFFFRVQLYVEDKQSKANSRNKYFLKTIKTRFFFLFFFV